MERDGVWLGLLRKPIKWAMYVSLAVLAASYLWVIFADLALGWDIGMQEMLRPDGSLSAYLILWSFFCSVLFSSLYLSDNIGAIEPRPDGFFDWFSLILGRVGMIAIVFIVLVMMYEVAARYVFEKPTLWANELSLWVAGFTFLLAGLYAMQQRSHIRIYIIYDIMPRWAQKTSDIISVVLIWCFTIALVWGGYNEASAKLMRWEKFGTAWDPPLPATLKTGILVIISLVAVQAFSNLIADWNKAPEHHSPADEIDDVEIENIRSTLGEKN